MRRKLYEVLCKMTLEDFQNDEEMKTAIALKDLIKPIVKPRGRRTKKEPTVGV
jgi:hypothetical protein